MKKMDERELLYEDWHAKIWSNKGQVNDEVDEDDIKIVFKGEEYTLLNFMHFYDNDDPIISLKLKLDPLRLLYYIHKENIILVDMSEIFEHHHILEETFEKGSVPLER